MTKSINALMIEALKAEGIECDFEVIRVSQDSDEKTLKEMAAYVASVMNTKDIPEEDEFQPLEFRVYNATDDSGDYIADALITCGGPNVRVRYEGGVGYAVIRYKWGHDYLDVKTNTAPIAGIMETYSTYA